MTQSTKTNLASSKKMRFSCNDQQETRCFAAWLQPATRCFAALLSTLLLASSARLASAVSERIDILDVVSVEDAPWAVVVLSGNNQMFCTGTLLHASWVLTSAHCLYDEEGLFTEDDGSVTVIAGADRLNYTEKDVSPDRVQIRRSTRLVVHDDYSFAENFINDLALIRLERPLALGRRAEAARLPVRQRMSPLVDRPHKSTHADFTPFVCDCSGFGKIMRYADHRNDYSLKLQQFEVSKQCHCLDKLRSVRSAYSVLGKRNRFICDVQASWAGLCMGDNGAQLVCAGTLRAIGTTILHYDMAARCVPSGRRLECGDRRTMSVFTDLCPYARWIGEHVPDVPQPDEEMCSDAIGQPFDDEGE